MDFVAVKPFSIDNQLRSTATAAAVALSLPSAAHAVPVNSVIRARFESGMYSDLQVVASSSQTYVENIVHGVSGTWLKTPGAITLPAANVDNALFKVMAKVRSYFRLDRGWDGYSGVKIDRSAISDAEVFAAYHASFFERVMPSISCAGDGEINFTWRTASGVIDLGFYGDGSYSYYAKAQDGRVFSSDTENLSSRLPEDVLGILA